MAFLLTRSGLDQFRGRPGYVDELLQIAGDNPTDQQTMVDGALLRATQWVGTYAPQAAMDDPATCPTLTTKGFEEALYELQQQRLLGLTDTEIHLKEARDEFMEGMRTRKRWPAGAENLRAGDIGIVESGRRISRVAMQGGYL